MMPDDMPDRQEASRTAGEAHDGPNSQVRELYLELAEKDDRIAALVADVARLERAVERESRGQEVADQGTHPGTSRAADTAPDFFPRPEARHVFGADEAPAVPASVPGPSPETSPSAILVLGMHRSGTSALTGCLLGLGVPLGRPLLPATPGENAGGCFEVEGVRQLHGRILSAFGATPLDTSSLPAGWERHPVAREARATLAALLDEIFGSRPLWAVKDPRLCVLLPLWLPLLEERGVEPRFVLAHRNPWEIARSLGKRGVPAFTALAAWLAHVESAERLTRGRVRTVARYADLLARPVAELERIGTALGTTWPFPPAGERSRIDAFLHSELRTWRGSPPPMEAGPRVAAAFERLAEALDAADNGANAHACIDEAASACHDLLADRGWPERGPQPDEDTLKLKWFAPEVPTVMRAGTRCEVGVSFRNLARTTLPHFALSVSYHWRDAARPGDAELFEGLRTPVSRAVPPGAREDLLAVVEAPARPGSYLLEIDLVRESLTWLSCAGVPGPAVPVTVTAD